MNEIKEKIAILLDYSNEDSNASNVGFESIINKIKQQDVMLDELENDAIKNNTLLGRTINFPMADSYAVYIITKINKNTVTLTWVDYADGWVDDRLGYEGNVSIEYATTKIKQKDALNKLFSK